MSISPCFPMPIFINKAQSGDGGRLWFDQKSDQRHCMRMVFAEHLTRQAIECQATRRVDRPETRFGMARVDY